MDKQTVVLLHGAGRAGRMWRRPAGLLADDYQVITPDLPGFRDATGQFTLDGAAGAVTEIARAHGSIHLCGLSLGATVAIRAAASNPDNVASLMLCAPALAPQRYQPHLVRRYHRIPDLVARLFSDAASWRNLIDTVAEVDVEDDLPAIRSSTLVVCGARDRTSLPDARRAADRVPAARLLVLPHLRHAWPVTAPKVFRSVVDNFVGDIASRRQEPPV